MSPMPPELPNEVHMLSLHKQDTGYSNAQLAVKMNFFKDWSWGAVQLDRLFSGRAKPSEEQKDFIIRFLCEYYVSTL